MLRVALVRLPSHSLVCRKCSSRIDLRSVRVDPRLTRQTWLRTTAIRVALVAAVAGCKTYEPKPLDATQATTEWRSRSPNSESVRAFAERLAKAEPDAPIAFDATDGLTLREAEPVALVFNPDLRVARMEAHVARATAEFAGLWQDPVAGFELAQILEGVSDPWFVAPAVDITIPISGTPEAAKALADAAYVAELRRIAAQEWEVRADLRETWISWSAQIVRAELAEAVVVELRAVADLAERQHAAGVLSRLDARVFVVECAGRAAEAIEARARAQELELELLDILGLAPGTPLKLVPTLAFAPRASEEGALQDALLKGNAQLATLRESFEVADRSLKLEIRKQYPDLTIGPGYLYDTGTSGPFIGFSLPIPLWNRNQQGVAQAIAEREVARARFESAYEHAASRLAVAWTRYSAGCDVRAALESTVVPIAEEQDAAVRHVATLGRVDPFLLLRAIDTSNDAKVRLATAQADESIGAVRIDELLGPPEPPPTETDASPLSPETQDTLP